MELNRFKQLLESTMGNVKPLINEDDENKKVSNFLSSVDADGDGEYDDYDGTNEDLMYKTIISISSSSEYFKIDGEVKKKTGKPISFWIKNELQKAMDILAVGNCDESSDYYRQVKMFCHMNDIGVSKQSEWTKDDCKKFFKNCDGDSDSNGTDSNSSIWPTNM
jgi:hypothetical protein